MKRVLITGGSGFIGRNLTVYMQNMGYVVSAPGHQELDLLDIAIVGQYLKKGKYDVVIHAANTNMLNSNQYDILNTNLRMFYNLEKHQNEYGKLFYFGSGAEYDRVTMPRKVKEEQFGAFIPSDPYGFTKYLMRKTALQQNNIYDICIFGVYGKYEQWERRFISNNIVRSLKGLPMTLSKNAYFDYLYIDDLCKIVVWLIEADLEYKCYNVCTSEPVDLLFLANRINHISGGRSEILIKEPGWQPEYSGNNDRLLAEMKEFKFVKLEQSIQELWNYYENHIDEIDEKKLLL
jgi:UDP-glucose 4-epimerase